MCPSRQVPSIPLKAESQLLPCPDLALCHQMLLIPALASTLLLHPQLKRKPAQQAQQEQQAWVLHLEPLHKPSNTPQA